MHAIWWEDEGRGYVGGSHYLQACSGCILDTPFMCIWCFYTSCDDLILCYSSRNHMRHNTSRFTLSIRLTEKVKLVFAQVYFFFSPPRFSQPKCLTSPTWRRSVVLTRQSWRRRRQKRKTLCPPKRVSVPPVRLWAAVKSSPPTATIFLSVTAHHFRHCQKMTRSASRAEQMIKQKRHNISTSHIH